ncbi:hypothetical protein H1S01_05330 [Heliobacterium chlorum]|uniref:Uncharacterized protein n=1 Tax=Heliobacterium chlorum TaxID=2698 RepID=A0ABR7SZS2_HELCL|nr:hypothetical protein [Heliobacterium chlorum]MBC9783931.1 hypothetical protein [Heliobacterium chlorum]
MISTYFTRCSGIRKIFLMSLLPMLLGAYLWFVIPCAWTKVDRATIQWQSGGYAIVTLNAKEDRELVKDIFSLLVGTTPMVKHVGTLREPLWVVTLHSENRQVFYQALDDGYVYRKIWATDPAVGPGWYLRIPGDSVTKELQQQMLSSFEDPQRVLPVSAQEKAQRQEGQLARFVTGTLMNDQGGVYTNFRDDRPEKRDEARNHDILSESTGLLMEYALQTNDHELYRQQVAYARKHLSSPYGVLSWKVRDADGKSQPSSALIDDLRIAAALIQGYERWQERQDLMLARGILEGVYRFEQSSGSWRPWYDWSGVEVSWKSWHENLKANGASVLPVRYLAPDYIKIAATVDERFADLAPQATALIKTSDLHNGLFATDLDPAKGPLQEKLEVNMIDSLLTAWNGARGGYVSKPTVEFLKRELKKGHIYASYHRNQQKKAIPMTQVESPAVYALAALFLWQAGEPDWANSAVDHLLLNRISNEQSPFFGGFGDPRTGDCYSFDNLMALQALSVVRK